jgi:hypothetical protein
MMMDGEKPPEEKFEYSLNRAQLGMAHRAAMLDDLNQVLASNRAAKESHNKTHFPNYQTPEEPVIHIGDIHNEARSTQPPKPPEPPRARTGMHPVLAGLIGAGLAASGIGIPAAGYFIADAIKNIKPGEGDGNNQYQLKLLP